MLLWDTFFAAGQGQLAKGAYGKAEELLKSALTEAEGFPSNDPRLLQTRLAIVEVHQKSGRLEAAVPVLELAAQQVAEAPDLPPELSSTLLEARLRQVDLEQGPPEQRTELAAQLVQLWEQAGPDHLAALVEALRRLSDFQRAAEDRRAARRSLERALEKSLELHGVAHPAPAEVMNLLARAHLENNEVEAAERVARSALSTLRQVVDAKSDQLAEPLAFLAHVLERQKRFDEALDMIELAAELEGPRQRHFQLEQAGSLLRAGRAQEALTVLLTLDRARLESELLSRYELYRLRAFKGVGDRESLKEQAQKLSFSEEADAAARGRAP
jgi:tetratricopeptide (TPR) repeat protein